MASPWAKIPNVEPVDFKEIMSEEVAKDLQAKEERLHAAMIKTPEEEIPPEIDQAEENSCENDELIALTLQKQFDKEYDERIIRTQQKINGKSKVSISYQNYLRAPQGIDFESESEEEEIVDIRDRKDWDRFDIMQRQVDSIPACGYKMENGSIVTKHDVTISGRKNACKMLSFPPDFHTGDGENFDMKLSNKVFNSLKRHSQIEQARRHKVKDPKKDKATAEFGMDEHTALLCFKLVNSGLLESVGGTISVGKEAVILHAIANPNFFEDRVISQECVIKVFKTTLSEYKQRDQYIRDDYRFKDRIGKQNTRKIVPLWTEKEMHNLIRLKNANIPCPEVVAIKEHILLMSFIGKDNRAAPKLKDAAMDAADYIVAYDQIVENMKKLFNEANLIHADLSEYNVLWHEGQCYFIDVSQAVMPSHENAFFFLMRDCNNIIKFFHKKNVPEILSPEELFKSITGCYYEEQLDILKLQEKFKMKPHLVFNSDYKSRYNFDEAWVTSKKGQSQTVDPPLA